jgi:hypothetical protein
MPVSNLLCEGVSNGWDVRLLRGILKGIRLEVVPSGGKDGFRNTIFAWRYSDRNVCAFRDNDFPRKPDEWKVPPASEALEWQAKHDGSYHMIGWMWCRKEIENYFVDPNVLARVFQWDDKQKAYYVQVLERIFDSLAGTTAARMALTACAPERNRVKTEMPLHGTRDEMRNRLAKIAQEHNKGALLDETDLQATFDALLPDCQSGGRFRAHALHVFAGKNIVDKLQQTPGAPVELKNKDALFERILTALEQVQEPHTWLPEWTAIRNAVTKWTP